MDVPRPVKTAQNPLGRARDEVINLILKFIYHNQDFEAVKAEVNETNVMEIYSQAYMMRSPNLLRCLEERVVNELVNPTNATAFYVDAILFEAQPIFDACECIIQFNIEKIIEDEKASEFLMTLPFKRMHSLCKDDKLHVKHEGQLLRLIDRYLEARDKKEGLPPLEDETDAVVINKLIE